MKRRAVDRMSVKNHKKTDINLMRFDKMNERTVYSVGGAGLLISHVLYLVIFAILGVTPMILFNIFSVVFYSVLIFLLFHTLLRKELVLAALAEVMLHSCLGVYTIGWQAGFAMFLLFIMPVPFYMPLKRLLTPYLFSLVPLVLFIGMHIGFGATESAMYSFRDPVICDMIYVLNAVMGTVILIYISSIYMFERELMKLKLTTKNERLQKLATLDPLTQLFNRRAMGEYLRLVQHNSERSGKGYAVGLGDIDDFKKINDTYGHEAGDEALKQTAGIIARSVPTEGYAARWGGEEFLFVIPNAELEDGIDCAENIRSELNAKVFKADEKSFGITVTIGVSTGEPGEDIEKVISRADGKLYQGKKAGKNKVAH